MKDMFIRVFHFQPERRMSHPGPSPTASRSGTAQDIRAILAIDVVCMSISLVDVRCWSKISMPQNPQIRPACSLILRQRSAHQRRFDLQCHKSGKVPSVANGTADIP